MVWTDTWSTGSPGTTEMLVAVRTGGSTVGVDGGAALAFALDPVHPNAKHGHAPRVTIVLPSDAPAQVELLDLAGRRLAVREVGAMGAGWHGVDLGNGPRLAPGPYLLRLRQGSSTRVRRVVVL